MIALGDATWIALFGMALGFGVLVTVIIAMFRNRGISAKLGSMEVKLDKIEVATNGPLTALSREVSTIAGHVKCVVDTLDNYTSQSASREQAVDARFEQLETRVSDLTTLVKGI